MLADAGDGGDGETQKPVRELPPDPPDPVRAKKAERIVVACFLIAMLAGFGFLVAYGIIGVGSITKALHSNLALGGTLSLVLLLLAIGAVIWVRHLMPDVELTEERHPMRSDAQARAAFKETFEEGADTSQFVKRPMVRRSLIAATVPLAVAPSIPAARPRAAAGEEPGYHRLAQGPSAGRVRHRQADHPGRVQLAWRHHQRRARGLPER